MVDEIGIMDNVVFPVTPARLRRPAGECEAPLSPLVCFMTETGPSTTLSLIRVLILDNCRTVPASDVIRLVVLNLDPVLSTACSGEIVGGLQPHPVVARGPSDPFQADGHFGRNARSFVDQIIQGLMGHTEKFGCPGHGQFQGIDTILPDNTAWMGWILHRHG